jgi:hypothetical protein
MPKHSNWRANQKLELIHADICGPISPKSNNGKRYILCFIDDFSRNSWAFLLATKSEAFIYFKKFKAMVEKETLLHVKCLRTDRGGEFTSSEFNEFCSQQGIKRQLTTAYTPQQNGVAERKNRTVMNMVRSILSGKGIPKPFWPEAVNWAFYVLNRCPTYALTDITPHEAWSGTKPSVDHFRVFGCLAHVHVPDVKRSKLDNKSFVCALLGMSDESKGYRLFDPLNKKIVVSKDVIFEEDKQWDWDVAYEEKILTDLVWGDREGTSEDGDDSDDNHGDESGEREAEINGEEGEENEEHRHIVCEDDENAEREEEEAELNDPTVCMLPVGRIGEQVNPTARTRPSERREMTDGEIDANPTVRIQSDRESDQLTCGVHPTAQNMADGENELLTSGDNPTADMQSYGESGLLTSGRRERGPPVWMQDYVTGEDLSEYESNMALIMSSDPIYFEDAVKVKH